MPSLVTLVRQVSACRICATSLPHGPRPVFQIHPAAKILIAAQAPGRRGHLSGVPFDDASGVRLREWMGLSREAFHDPKTIAILPMGFCYRARDRMAMRLRALSARPPGVARCSRTFRGWRW